MSDEVLKMMAAEVLRDCLRAARAMVGQGIVAHYSALEIVIDHDTDKGLCVGLESSVVVGPPGPISTMHGAKLMGMEVVVEAAPPAPWGVRTRKAMSWN